MTEFILDFNGKYWEYRDYGNTLHAGHLNTFSSIDPIRLQVEILAVAIDPHTNKYIEFLTPDKITIVRDGSHLTTDPQPDTLGGGGRKHSTAIDPDGIWSLLATNKE